MHRLPWMDSMNIGIAPLDDAHRDMFYLMGDLSEAVHAHAVGPALSMAVDFLRRLDVHFHFENEMMARLGFPGADAHRAKHDATRAQVASLEQALRDDNISRASWLLGELESRYFRELLNEDMVLARYAATAAP